MDKYIVSQHSVDPRPFVKWAGGKKQILSILNEFAPQSFGNYFEPFVGGGALLFSLLPKKACISDLNQELINCYEVIRDKVDLLIADLSTHKNEKDYFYEIRAELPATEVHRASRFIFLNKTCFNGLYRENSKGQFNVPFGNYKNPKILDRENLLAVSRYLKSADLQINCGDYRGILDQTMAGDFVYFDPPYLPFTKTASFTKYTGKGFEMKDQEELVATFADLSKKGVFLMLSNSNVPIIHSLYAGFNIRIVHASRSINSVGGGRGKEANEVLVTNY